MTSTQSDIREYICLDFGAKRIGVARINSAARLPESLPALSTEESVADTLKQLVDTQAADGVVVGLPRGLDGQETAQTQAAKEFAQSLKEELNIPVYMIDEAASTKTAQERIGTNAESLDSAAAQVIATDFVAFTDKELLRI